MVINCSLPNWAVKVSTKETYAGVAKGMYNYIIINTISTMKVSVIYCLCQHYEIHRLL
jgi:hypothetical protein